MDEKLASGRNGAPLTVYNVRCRKGQHAICFHDLVGINCFPPIVQFILPGCFSFTKLIGDCIVDAGLAQNWLACLL